MKRKTRILAYCSILSALSVVILLAGSFFSVLDLSAAALASFVIIFVISEIGRPQAFVVFAVTALLSLILLPERSPAVFYSCFIGYYPILKSLIETRLPRFIGYALKLISFTAAFALILFVSVKLLDFEEFVGLYAVGLVALGYIAFILYDLALSHIILFYYKIIRPRLNIGNKFRK